MESDWLAGLLVFAAGKYPWIVTAMLVMAALRIVLKPAFTVWHWIVARTVTPKDDEFLARVENSRALQIGLWVLDYVASVKVLPMTPTQKRMVKLNARAQEIAQKYSELAAKRGKLFLVLIGAAVVGLVTGCAGFRKQVVTVDPVTQVATTNEVFDVSRLAPAAKTAAFVGTQVALEEHPEWHDGFEEALADLWILERAERIDFTALLAIVNRLPVKELKSKEARLAITGGTMLLEQYGDEWARTALDRVNDLKPVVTALRQGIELGLEP